VGKRRLEKAISSFNTTNPDVLFKVQWLPYQLDPTRTDTVNKLEHYRKKFGKERVETMIPQMTITAKEEGIDMSYGGVISNTLDSHRLLWWANTLDKQNEVLEQVMKLYFEQEKDIGDREELATAAEKAGLNKSEVLDFFNSSKGVSEVKSLLSENTQMGITGVPFYILQDK
jgi:predicted DsbA family dithiol-disulfide isomerase